VVNLDLWAKTVRFSSLRSLRKSLKIPKGLSEAVNRGMIYNTMAKKKDKGTNNDLHNTTQKVKDRATRVRILRIF
jgi:hypothetical protein